MRRQCQMNTLMESILPVNLVILETPCWTIKINQNNVQGNVTTKRAPFKTSKNILHILYVHCIIPLYFYRTLFGLFTEIKHFPNFFKTGNNNLMLQIKELELNYIKFCKETSIKEGYQTSAITKMNICVE